MNKMQKLKGIISRGGIQKIITENLKTVEFSMNCIRLQIQLGK